MILIMGDFNAKIGREAEVKGVAGINSLHPNTSENGWRIIQHCMQNKLHVRSTHFPRKDIYKGTWKAPNGTYMNQIDHVLVNNRYVTSVIDVKTCRGTNCDSDQHLVKTVIWQRLSNIGKIKGQQRTGWGVERLSEDNYKRIFEEVISKQLHDDNESSNIEEVWNDLKKTLSETSKEVLVERKRPDRREWYDNDCRMLVEKKNEIRKKMLQRETRATVDAYKNARKEATKLCRKKKKALDGGKGKEN